MAEGSAALNAASVHGSAPGRRRYGPLALGAALALVAVVLPPLLAAIVLAAMGVGLLVLARPTEAQLALVVGMATVACRLSVEQPAATSGQRSAAGWRLTADR